MQFVCVMRNLTVAVAALSMCASPTLASVSATSQVRAVPVQTISPMVALSIFGSQASAAALCGSSATTAASAAATAQTPAGGCVLPVVDAPPPPPFAEAAPLPPPSGGFGLSPILLGLVTIGILVGAFLLFEDLDDDKNPPVSVN